MSRRKDPLTWSPSCPFCDSGATAILWTLPNAFRVFINLLIPFVRLALIVLAGVILGMSDGMPEHPRELELKRRCRACGGIFFADASRAREATCGQCGYDLTGNVSGVCPECGWRIPHIVEVAIKQKHRLVNRSEPSQAGPKS